MNLLRNGFIRLSRTDSLHLASDLFTFFRGEPGLYHSFYLILVNLQHFYYNKYAFFLSYRARLCALFDFTRFFFEVDFRDLSKLSEVTLF